MVKLDPDRFKTALETVASHGICEDPEFAKLLDVGSGEYLSLLETEVLTEFVTNGGATVRFVEGAYGAGKTHVLNLIAARASEAGMAVVKTDLSRAIKLQRWDHLVRHILHHVELQHDAEVVSSFPEILGWVAQNSERRVDLPERADHAGFLRGAKSALEWGDRIDGARRDLLYRFLVGDSVSVRVLKQVGIHGVKGRLSQRNAELVLFTVLEILWRTTGAGTVVLFDENEHSLETPRRDPSRALRIAANHVRRLIDATVSARAKGVLFVFAVLPGFVERCGSVYPALEQRVAAPDLGASGAPWRSPYLRVDDLNTVAERNDFLKELITRIVTVSSQCGFPISGARAEMLRQGQALLANEVGSGYRRRLFRTLASIAIQRMT